MKESFKAKKISDNVYWVGAVDWNLRNFHGYHTLRGSSYNAFLIKAEKLTLIDTVKRPYLDELMARISSVVNPEDIDYIVCNHAEMDHSGALPEVVDIVKPEKVFASKTGVKTLMDHFHRDLGVFGVQDGEKISLGNMDLIFYESRMLHWPESMINYLPEDKILFSNDIFGMHYASSERFDDEADPSVLEFESAKYYANILLPYVKLISKFLIKFESLNLDIKMIAPDHGTIWRKDVSKIINLYKHWSSSITRNKAIIVYDTMWNSTGKMASAINEGLLKGGTETKIMPLDANDRSDIATEILDAGALIVGSPTINGTIFPTMADVLTYLKGLKKQGLVGAAFGSYGWSYDNIKQLNEYLEKMKIEILDPGLKVKYVPQDEDLKNCFELGERISERLSKNS